jgi:hypothetical protein
LFSLAEKIRLLDAEGLPLKEIAQTLSERYGIARREIYALGVQLKKEREGGSERE